MTAGRNKKEKDVINRVTKEELTCQYGLLRQIMKRFYKRALQAESDEHLGYVKNNNAESNLRQHQFPITTVRDKRTVVIISFKYMVESLMSVLTDRKNCGTNDTLIAFPDDDSIYKVMNLVIKNASVRWTMLIKEWTLAVKRFSILFERCLSS